MNAAKLSWNETGTGSAELRTSCDTVPVCKSQLHTTYKIACLVQNRSSIYPFTSLLNEQRDVDAGQSDSLSG